MSSVFTKTAIFFLMSNSKITVSGKFGSLSQPRDGKNSTGNNVSDVGMFLIPIVHKVLMNTEEIKTRIQIASFNSNPITTIICCPPTYCSVEEMWRINGSLLLPEINKTITS